ncbi:MAG: tail fiber assembly protein [Aeromonas hydrophila]
MMKIEILGASAPYFSNNEGTAINLMVSFAHLDGEAILFTASQDDTAEHGRELYQRAKDGEFGEVGPYTGPTPYEELMATFPARKRAEMERVEALIAPLERARRLGVATEEELAELASLELYTIELMRAEGPALPARV